MRRGNDSIRQRLRLAAGESVSESVMTLIPKREYLARIESANIAAYHLLILPKAIVAHATTASRRSFVLGRFYISISEHRRIEQFRIVLQQGHQPDGNVHTAFAMEKKD